MCCEMVAVVEEVVAVVRMKALCGAQVRFSCFYRELAERVGGPVCVFVSWLENAGDTPTPPPRVPLR